MATQEDDMDNGLKLYVWDNVLCDAGCGIMFALARSEDEAKKLIMKDNGYESWLVTDELNKKPDVYTDTAVGFVVWGGG
jgi:hypothetical protein